MADEITRTDQPGGDTQTGGDQPSGYDSFLGTDAGVNFADEQNPEPSADEADELVEGTEAEPEGEEAAETEQTDAADKYSAFVADLSPEEQAYYAKRYPTLLKAAQDANQPTDLRQAFIDRVNQDRKFEAQRNGTDVDEEEPTLDETGEDDAQATPSTPAEAQKLYYERIEQFVSNNYDKEQVAAVGRNVMGAILKASGLDPNSADPDVKKMLEGSGELGHVLAVAATDIVNSALPHLLAQAQEAAYPGFSQMYQQSSYIGAWDAVRNSQVKGEDGQVARPYAELPGYGTKEFTSLLERAAKQIPGFDEMVFTKTVRTAQGLQKVPLTQQEQVKRKYEVLAQVAAGQKVNPTQVKEAVETGKKLERRALQTRAAGRALGAGQSLNKVGTKSSGDDLMDALDMEINRQNADLKPVSRR